MSDVCTPSFLLGNELPILRVIPFSGSKNFTIDFAKAIKLNTQQGQCEKIRIYIKTKNFSKVSDLILEGRVTLRFKNVSY
jgi:hypothetical protein